jgi:hypothetical protein
MITRINQLKNQTNSNKIKTICESAIGMLSSTVYNNITPEAKYEIERSTLENLFENLEKYKKDFIIKEWLDNTKRIYLIKNIGIRKAIAILEQSEARYNPTLNEILKQYKEILYSEVPEILLYEDFLPALSNFSYLPTVQQQIDHISSVIKKYNIDIEINKVIEAMKSSRSNYLIPLIEDVVETYLTNKTEQSKHYLKETLIKFSYDDYVRSIINLVNADATQLQLEYANSFCDVEKVYSPLLYLGENEVTFNIKGKYFVKKGNLISKLSETQVHNLNPEFISLCEIANSSNVFFKDDNNIEVYINNDVAIINDKGVQVNEFVMTPETINESLEMAPLTGNAEFYSLVKTLYENFNEIAEVDFVKRVSLKENIDYSADIFKLRDNIYICTYDPINNKDTFYKNVNPIQAKNIMMEHLRYDITKVFKDILPKEEKILAEVEETKIEYANYINLIEEKINILQYQVNSDTKEQLIKMLQEELSEIQEEYKDYLNEIEKYVRPLSEDDEKEDEKEDTFDDDDDEVGSYLKKKELERNMDESVTVTVDVDGKKYIVPIPKAEGEEGAETGDEDSLTANYTNDEPASQITFDDEQTELLGDSPSIQSDEIDIDQEEIENEIDTQEKEKKEEEPEETEEKPGTEEEKPEEEGGTEVTSDEEENKESEEDEEDEEKKKEKKPLKKESFIKETKKTKKVFLKKKLTESHNINESYIPNVTDNVMFKNQKASIIGQMSNGDYILQLSRSGSTEYAKPNEVKIIDLKAETMKPPFKFDEKTQKLLFEQYVRCGIYMGRTPIKLTNCYVKYSDWANVPNDRLVNVLVEGELSMLPREQVNILEDPNEFANPANYVQGVLVDESGVALKNVLINAIDYTQGIGDADMVRVLDTDTNELTSYPKSALKTLSI